MGESAKGESTSPAKKVKKGGDDWISSPIYRQECQEMNVMESITVSHQDIIDVYNKKFKNSKIESIDQICDQSCQRDELEYFNHLLHYKDVQT